ncbi:hypothetical protein K5F93_05035 [Pseudomonas protegens]|nr:hypothetical protein K5F93_05035 [Pseudomonas protegens]
MEATFLRKCSGTYRWLFNSALADMKLQQFAH